VLSWARMASEVPVTGRLVLAGHRARIGIRYPRAERWGYLPMSRRRLIPSVLINGIADADPLGARTMSKYERRMFFERLMRLRDEYQAERHEATALPIRAAMAWANAAMR